MAVLDGVNDGVLEPEPVPVGEMPKLCVAVVVGVCVGVPEPVLDGLGVGVGVWVGVCVCVGVLVGVGATHSVPPLGMHETVRGMVNTPAREGMRGGREAAGMRGAPHGVEGGMPAGLTSRLRDGPYVLCPVGRARVRHDGGVRRASAGGHGADGATDVRLRGVAEPRRARRVRHEGVPPSIVSQLVGHPAGRDLLHAVERVDDVCERHRASVCGEIT